MQVGGTDFFVVLFSCCSQSYAIDKIKSSSYAAPIICAPTGNPSLVNPIGILIAGKPMQLKMMVFLSKASRVFKVVSSSILTVSSSNLGAGIIVVGTISASTLLCNMD